jgi:hypothetical protein
MPVEKLTDLRGGGTRLREKWHYGRARDDLCLRQCSGQSMSGTSRIGERGGSGSLCSASHFRQRMIPRKLQITQMNVPQLTHG